MATKRKESQEPNKTPLSQTRRSVLKKMLVGTGVASGAAALPEKWTKPFIEAVILPTHAQTSAGNALSINNFVIANPGPKQSGAAVQRFVINSEHEFRGSFSYSDETCEVNSETTLQYNVTPDGVLNFASGATLSSIRGTTNSGDGCSGTITFPFTINADPCSNPTLGINIGVNGRTSNWDYDTIPLPCNETR